MDWWDRLMGRKKSAPKGKTVSDETAKAGQSVPSPDDTQDLTEAPSAAEAAAADDSVANDEKLEAAESVTAAAVGALPVGQKVRIVKNDPGVYGVEGEIVSVDGTNYQVKLLAPCYGGAVVKYEAAEVIAI